MGDPSQFEVSCGGITREQVVDSEDEFQVFGTITNVTNDADSISIRVDAVGPDYPPDTPFTGQENRQRLDSVYAFVGANRSESWSTDPEDINLGSFRPPGEYTIEVTLVPV